MLENKKRKQEQREVNYLHSTKGKRKVLGVSFLIVLLLFNPSISDFQKWLTDTYRMTCHTTSCYATLVHTNGKEETTISSRSFLFFSIFSLQSKEGEKEEKVFSMLGFFVPYDRNQADGILQK